MAETSNWPDLHIKALSGSPAIKRLENVLDNFDNYWLFAEKLQGIAQLPSSIRDPEWLGALRSRHSPGRGPTSVLLESLMSYNVTCRQVHLVLTELQFDVAADILSHWQRKLFDQGLVNQTQWIENSCGCCSCRVPRNLSFCSLSNDCNIHASQVANLNENGQDLSHSNCISPQNYACVNRRNNVQDNENSIISDEMFSKPSHNLPEEKSKPLGTFNVEFQNERQNTGRPVTEDLSWDHEGMAEQCYQNNLSEVQETQYKWENDLNGATGGHRRTQTAPDNFWPIPPDDYEEECICVRTQNQDTKNQETKSQETSELTNPKYVGELPRKVGVAKDVSTALKPVKSQEREERRRSSSDADRKCTMDTNNLKNRQSAHMMATSTNHGQEEKRKEQGPKIFLSYAHHSMEHLKEVVTLCNLLTNKGYTVRCDIFDDDLKTHIETGSLREQFSNQNEWIDKCMREAEFVIFCITPTYIETILNTNSTDVCPRLNDLHAKYIYNVARSEFILNRSSNKRFIPILHRNLKHSDINQLNVFNSILTLTFPEDQYKLLDYLEYLLQ